MLFKEMKGRKKQYTTQLFYREKKILKIVKYFICGPINYLRISAFRAVF